MTSAVPIPVIGVIGGIGSGKTALANAVSAILNSRRLDADVAGHRALQQPDVQQEIRRSFGNEVLDEEGNVDRPLLARRVFGEGDEQKRERKQLEQIVHPVIRNLIEQELAEIRNEHSCDVVLLDAALLLEAEWDSLCDAVVFVDVPREQRLRRVHSRGWSPEDFRRREASQMEIDEKRRRADKVIENSGDLDAAGRTLADWIQSEFLKSTNDSLRT